MDAESDYDDELGDESSFYFDEILDEEGYVIDFYTTISKDDLNLSVEKKIGAMSKMDMLFCLATFFAGIVAEIKCITFSQARYEEKR